jgi:transglutaminase-like putative cysteine protease
MVRATRLGFEDVQIRMFAEGLVQNLWPHDYLSEYAAILNWVRSHVRYVRDPAIIEQVKTPQVVLETKTGDCDDQCVLLGTLVGTLGGRVRYVAGAFKKNPDGSPNFAHVWCEVYDPASKAWVVLDPVPGRNVASMLRRLLDTIIVEAT